VRVSRASHADIANNTIDNNGGIGTLADPLGDGISVSENSGVNLGTDTIVDVVEDTHNFTTTGSENTGDGIRCSINSYANGVLGTLANNGLNGSPLQSSFSGTCVNSLLADHIP